MRIILVFFSLSYLLRVIYDLGIGFHNWEASFAIYMISTFSGVPFDLVPIIIVLLFHRRNLNCSTKEILYDEVSSQESLSDGMHAEKPYYNSDSNEEDEEEEKSTIEKLPSFKAEDDSPND